MGSLAVNLKARPRHEKVDMQLFVKKNEESYIDLKQDTYMMSMLFMMSIGLSCQVLIEHILLYGFGCVPLSLAPSNRNTTSRSDCNTQSEY